MKSVFDKPTLHELITRINTIDSSNTAQWGNMNVFQMLKHCTLWDDMVQGNTKVKTMFLGRIFGRMALKGVLKDDSPLRKNSPSAPALIIKDKSGDVQQQRTEWLTKISAYEHFNDQEFIHPFFGVMTKEQIGQLAYKHSDHHLRQFGA